MGEVRRLRDRINYARNAERERQQARERERQQARERYEKLSPEQKEQRIELIKKRNKAYRENPENLDRLRHFGYINSRKFQLKRSGWTLDTYKKAEEAQNKCCAICGREAKEKLHADHEHVEPPKPRGLLCGNCNMALGLLQDDPAICKAAAAYLEFYKKGSE